MATVSGTFTGTGNSAAIVGGKIWVSLSFAGTATVNVQAQADGSTWRTVQSYTASTETWVDSGGVPIRLNCSAYTNDVTYALRNK